MNFEDLFLSFQLSNHLACLKVLPMYYLQRFASSLHLCIMQFYLMHQETWCHLGTFWFNEYKTSSFHFWRNQWLYELLKINSKLYLDFICRLNRSTYACPWFFFLSGQWHLNKKNLNILKKIHKSTSLSKRSEKII